MAIINRSGVVRGQVGDEVFYNWRGRQAVRKPPAPYRSRNTIRWQEAKYYMATFGALWPALPAKIKGLWETYAAMQGSASVVEASDSVSYLHNPIPNYPPRPKLVNGENMFASANCRAAMCGISAPRYYPPIGVEIAPCPILEFRGFDRASGEIVIAVKTPELGERSEQMSDRKICIWINALRRKYIVHKYCLDIVDCPAKPTTLELRYKQVDSTKNEYGNKPLVFGKIDWVNIDIAANVVTARGEKWAPQVSSGSNSLVFTLLNDPRLVDIHDLIASGQLLMLNRIKFNDTFYKKIARMRAQEFVEVNPAKKRLVAIGN